jgi:hypothetical protein
MSRLLFYWIPGRQKESTFSVYRNRSTLARLDMLSGRHSRFYWAKRITSVKLEYHKVNSHYPRDSREILRYVSLNPWWRLIVFNWALPSNSSTPFWIPSTDYIFFSTLVTVWYLNLDTYTENVFAALVSTVNGVTWCGFITIDVLSVMRFLLLFFEKNNN